MEGLTVGRMVHYVEANVDRTAPHRAAIVTEVVDDAERVDGQAGDGLVALTVFAPDDEPCNVYARYDETGTRELTWHWPERA